MNSSELIKNEIKRIENFGGNLHNSKATVGAVANHIMQKIKTGGVSLPCSADKIVENCFLDGWFDNSFYYYAISELCVLKALNFNNDIVDFGEEYQKVLEWSDNREEYRLAAVKEYENRSKIYQEGIQFIMDNYIPKELHSFLREYPKNGIKINKSNYKKRVTVGSKVWVEFGKRHANFDSKISNKKEYATFSRYIPATIKSLNAFSLVIEINDVEYDIDFWRVSHCIPE